MIVTCIGGLVKLFAKFWAQNEKNLYTNFRDTILALFTT
jgi:hypothetical protein